MLCLGVPAFPATTWSPMWSPSHCKVVRDVVNLLRTKNSRVKQNQMSRVTMSLNGGACAARNVTSFFVRDAKGGEEVGALIQAR